jgi:predicted ribosomally synthesized peptide with SipW-like signal peptide
MARTNLSRKLLLSLGTLGAVGAIAGLGTYAQFTDSTTASHTITSGTVDINLAGDGTSSTTATVTNFAAGDLVERAVDLTNDGNIALSGVTLSSTFGSNNLLKTGADGLTSKIERCAAGWVESTTGTPGGLHYTCVAGAQNVLSVAAGPQTNAALSNLDLSAGAHNHLVITTELPSTADNTYETLSNAVTYTFNATQRAGSNR